MRFVNDPRGKQTYWWVEGRGNDGQWDRQQPGQWDRPEGSTTKGQIAGAPGDWFLQAKGQPRRRTGLIARRMIADEFCRFPRQSPAPGRLTALLARV